MTWAVGQQLPAFQKLVLLMLANRTNSDTGQCNPSHERLAADCGMHKDSVTRAIKELEEKGLLEIQHRFQEGISLPNQYLLKIGGGGDLSTHPQVHTAPAVGAHSTDGRCSQHPRVGAHSTTKQEVKPGKEPGIETKAEARASRLPADWIPTHSEIAFCQTERPDLNPGDVASQFRDYWISQPGAKGRKLDWSATWRNWVRNQRAAKQNHSYHDERAETIAALTGRNRYEHESEATDQRQLRIAVAG